ncbi:succinylglutamate desuccinylase/aspartoacylase family protein [Allohahella marinimesophila]|uniref:Succinylglutamate desuccinylase/aspartoacylase family protein n=1 Tax=Allohahella marinimesophila TaxID=1054972 RepID=A0ABP7NXV9_9GAMM
MLKAGSFEFLDEVVAPGTRKIFNLAIGGLYTQKDISVPIAVVHGKVPGPRLLVCAAIHGDELNGIEIVRRVLHSSWLNNVRGTLIAVPVVNVLGCIQRTRYLPDRRDLNRCFPGSMDGSLAGRIAHIFNTKVLQSATHAIDLHTGAIDRSNLPQIRVHLASPKAEEMAHAFGAPVIVNAPIRDGSLRGTGEDLGIPIITYEAGEALRYEEQSIAGGVRGVRRVMESLGMLTMRKRGRKIVKPVVARSSAWIRAPESGFLTLYCSLGDRIRADETIGMICGPLDDEGVLIKAPHSGIVIGRTNLPLAYEGEAVYHIARFDKVTEAVDVVGEFQTHMQERSAEQFTPIQNA